MLAVFRLILGELNLAWRHLFQLDIWITVILAIRWFGNISTFNSWVRIAFLHSLIQRMHGRELVAIWFRSNCIDWILPMQHFIVVLDWFHTLRPELLVLFSIRLIDLLVNWAQEGCKWCSVLWVVLLNMHVEYGKVLFYHGSFLECTASIFNNCWRLYLFKIVSHWNRFKAFALIQGLCCRSFRSRDFGYVLLGP